MSNAEGIPAADVKGTGWRISGSSGRKWYRIERGSKEFSEWVKFYRHRGKQDFANTIMHLGYSFVVGPSPTEHGAAQIHFMDQQIGGNA